MTLTELSVLKATIRKDVLACRDAIPDYLKATAENGIRARLLTEIMSRDGVISGFLPIRSEVDIRPALEDMAKAGRTVVLPVVIGRERLEFRVWTPETALVDAGFGTVGPGADVTVIDPDIVIAPFSAFDRIGNRIGYGAGHYDRALSRLRDRNDVHAVGAGFAAQEVEMVPTGEHDRPLDAIVTERETIKTGAA